MLDDTTATIISAGIGAGAGLVGLIWGVHTYKREQYYKRKEILFPLIEEFDKSKEMDYAKRILDGKNLKPERDWNYPWGYYNKFDLPIILRDGRSKGIDDPGEVDVRISFDALLDFFCKLEYLIKIELLKLEEVDYFKYYINIAAREEAIIEYLNYYSFPLYGKLDEELKLKKSSTEAKPDTDPKSPTESGVKADTEPKPPTEIGVKAKQYLNELYKKSEEEKPFKSYLVGYKLGFNPNQTAEIIGYLEKKELARQLPPSLQEGESSNLEITARGNEFILSGKPFTS